MEFWAKPRELARRRRWWEPRAVRSEVAWLPRYRVVVPAGAASWEVWLCGLEGSLSERAEPRAGAPAIEAFEGGPPPLLGEAFLAPDWRIAPQAAAAAARGHLVRSAHVLRLDSGLGEDGTCVERWRFPAHLEIFRRWGRWALRADDAVIGRRVTGVQTRALLDEVMSSGAE